MGRYITAGKILAALWVIVFLGCSTNQKSEDITSELADKLTDSMDFNGGTTVTGEKPQPNADNTAYPQVTKLEFPSDLEVGSFSVRINFTYSGSATDIAGAIVYVDKAGEYLQVVKSVTSIGEEMVLEGTFKGGIGEGFGKTYNVEVAVAKTDWVVGNYATAKVTPKEVPGTDGGTDAGTGPSADAGIDGGLYTWQDQTTGYIWQREPPAVDAITWQEATDYCNSLTLDGIGGWHLPLVNELRTIIRGCPATMTGGACTATDSCSCINADCFGCEYDKGPAAGCYTDSNLTGNCGYYWGFSTFTQLPTDAFVVLFRTGQVTTNDKGGNIPAVRCVRGP